MKCIRIRYFAMFKELAGVSEEEVTVGSKTYAELYREISEKYAFELPEEMIQVAVNDEFVPRSTIVSHGDKVVFIPPVAGG